jgi:hypothetical protein
MGNDPYLSQFSVNFEAVRNAFFADALLLEVQISGAILKNQRSKKPTVTRDRSGSQI